jgi:hypothetical protein
VPTISLGEWPLTADYFEEEFLSGVSPVLFAEDLDEAKRCILSRPETAWKDLERIQRMFFMPENIKLEAAFKVIKKPRLGEADYVFKNKNLDRLFEPVPSKKGKTRSSTIQTRNSV